MGNKKLKEKRIGEIINTKYNGVCKIIKYINNTNVDIMFEDKTVVKKVSYKQLKEGLVKNPNKISVYNVGYFGQGIYSKKQNEKAYKVWYSMLDRCYNKNGQNLSYKNTEVCKEWHNFQNFAKWFEENYIDGWCLDKDILSNGNKIYSPQTCCFIPRKLNNWFKKSIKRKSNLPTGVEKHGNKYRASIAGKHLGLFNTIKEAQDVHSKEKNKYINELVEEYKGLLSTDVYNKLAVKARKS